MLIKKFFKNKRGSVFVLVGLALGTMVVASGMSIDFGLTSATKNKAQQALDAATLAAAINEPTLEDDADLNNMVDRYFSLNFPSEYMGSSIDATKVQRTIDRSNNVVTANIPNARGN